MPSRGPDKKYTYADCFSWPKMNAGKFTKEYRTCLLRLPGSTRKYRSNFQHYSIIICQGNPAGYIAPRLTCVCLNPDKQMKNLPLSSSRISRLFVI
jgi:hypothetical protein